MNNLYFNSRGKPWKTGYVKNDQIPEERRTVWQKNTADSGRSATAPNPDTGKNHTTMTMDELMADAAKLSTQIAVLNNQLDAIKDEIRSRQPRNGDYVRGTTFLRVERAATFDKKLARQQLPQNELEAISELTPSPEKARQLWGKDSERYRSLCKENKMKLTIRPATDSEIDEAIKSQVHGGDDLAEPPEFLWPEV